MWVLWSLSPPHFAAIVLRSNDNLGIEGQLVMIKIIFSIIVENSVAISQPFFKPLVYLRVGVDSGTILRIVKPLDKLRIT